MNHRTLLATALVLSLLVPVAQTSAKENHKKGTTETERASWRQFQATATQDLNVIDRELKNLKTQIDVAPADKRDDLRNTWQEAEKLYNDLRYRVDNIGKSASEKWPDVRTSIQDHFKELRNKVSDLQKKTGSPETE